MMNIAAGLTDLTIYCKATADQQRLQILRVLSGESFGVLELCHILDTSQPALSHHLKILAEANLLETRRQGTSNYYRRALIRTQDPIRDLRESLFRAVDEIPLPDEQATRKAEIYEQRHEQALQFFRKNATRLQENQDLIAEYRLYAECLTGILENEQLDPARPVVELGPGESDLVCFLAGQFQHIIAIDSSAEMLARTRQKLAEAGLDNVVLIEGVLKDGPEMAGLIVLNMVLHHLASPSGLFMEAARKLAPGGRLLIADLASHDQHWTRDACGDLWQGFDASELDNWADMAGLLPGQTAYLGLNNGFQVQVHLYTRPEQHQT